MRDSIGQNEIDIACLAETNTNWKKPSSKAPFHVTQKDTGHTLIRQLLKQKQNGVTSTNRGELSSLLFHHSVPVLSHQVVIQ